jgi:PAS domain S-box-containing protein
MSDQARGTASDARSAAAQAVVDAIRAAAYMLDDHGVILAVNARAEELVARSAAELVGENAHELLHRNSYGAPLPITLCPLQEALMGERTAQGTTEERVERGDGTLMAISWASTPIECGTGHAGALVVLSSAEDPEPGDALARQPMSSLSELERLALLAETTTRLTSTLEVGETLDHLTWWCRAWPTGW